MLTSIFDESQTPIKIIREFFRFAFHICIYSIAVWIYKHFDIVWVP